MSAHASTELVTRVTHEHARPHQPNLRRPRAAPRRGLERERRRLTYTLTLRRDVRFSDGAPFTAADVMFSFAAAYSDGSQLLDGLSVGGKPLGVSAPDDHTVVIRFPSPFAPGLRVLDALPIFRGHTLEAALKEGRFDKAWTTATPLGNWSRSAPSSSPSMSPASEWSSHATRTSGARTPPGCSSHTRSHRRRDRLRPERRDAALQAGEFDLTTDEVRAEDIGAFRREAQAGRMHLTEVGVSLDANLLWFNLNPGAKAKDPRRAWLQSEQLRKAISHAVDRQEFINAVYLGAGTPIYGPVTPGNHLWYVPDLPTYPHDVARARALLAEVGLADRNATACSRMPPERPRASRSSRSRPHHPRAQRRGDPGAAQAGRPRG